MGLVVKNLPASAGDVRDTGLIHGSGRSPWSRDGNPLQYSRLGNPVDRGAWRAAVPGVMDSDMTEVTGALTTVALEPGVATVVDSVRPDRCVRVSHWPWLSSSRSAVSVSL